jgi:hypothetical protein
LCYLAEEKPDHAAGIGRSGYLNGAPAGFAGARKQAHVKELTAAFDSSSSEAQMRSQFYQLHLIKYRRPWALLPRVQYTLSGRRTGLCTAQEKKDALGGCPDMPLLGSTRGISSTLPLFHCEEKAVVEDRYVPVVQVLLVMRMRARAEHVQRGRRKRPAVLWLLPLCAALSRHNRLKEYECRRMRCFFELRKKDCLLDYSWKTAYTTDMIPEGNLACVYSSAEIVATSSLKTGSAYG